MPRTSLGKRNRDVIEPVPFHLPSKRSKRQLSTVIYNDENVAPELEIGGEIKDAITIFSHSTTLAKPPLTPSTPRHRDAYANSPTTPRHVVMSAGRLFKRTTPQSPLSPSVAQTVYSSARQLFARGSGAAQLVGRESEREKLTQFLEDASGSTSTGGCLYVSGPPGTGKSAMVTEVTKEYTEKDNVRMILTNCMSIKSSKDLYTTLLQAVDEPGQVSEADAIRMLQSRFFPKSHSSTIYLVVFDEIDHILSLGLESLYRLFEWSLQKDSKLVLIGIANALDLTDRFLPRLKSKNLSPQLLPFIPYNAGQIRSIITSRLASLIPAGKDNYIPFIHPAAIDLCSRKVASQTGDLRKAFEICRRALDVIEAETRSKHEQAARETVQQSTPTKRPLGEKVNEAQGSGRSVVQITVSSLKALTPETAPRASISHLNKITSAAFSNGTGQRLKALNLQQRAALCALVAFENRNRVIMKNDQGSTPSKSRSLAPTIKNLFSAYCTSCTRDSILHPLSSSEFREVVGSLETLGLVCAVEGKNGSFNPQTPSKRGRKGGLTASGDDRRVASCTGEKDMESVADGIGAGILRSILSGEALD